MFFVLIFTCVITIYMILLLREKLLKKPPTLSLVHIVLTNIKVFLNNSSLPRYMLFHKMAETYGDVFTCYLATKKFIVVNGGKAVTEIYRKGDAFAARSPNFSLDLVSTKYREAVRIIHERHWRLFRKIGHTSLIKHGVNNKSLERILKDETDSLIIRLTHKVGNTIEPTRELMLTVVNISSRIVFGGRYEFGNSYFEAVEDILNQSFSKDKSKSGSFLQSFLASIKKNDDERNAAEIMLEDLILKNKHEYDSSSLVTNVCTNIIKEIEDISEKLNIQDDAIKHYLLFTIVFEVFFSSLEPIIATLGWTLVHLTRHKHIEEKLQRELMNVDVLKMNNVVSLHYLRAVVHETHRYSSVVPLYPREALYDTQLSGFNIQKGSVLFINSYSIHHDNHVWKSPETFLPSRWLNEKGEFRLINSTNFAPFGGGRRRCFGEIMANQEILYIVARIVKQFDLSEDISNKHDVSAKEGTFNVPGAFNILIKQR